MTQQKITKAAIRDWFVSIKPGDQLVQGINTYWQEHDPERTFGRVFTVQRAGPTRIDAEPNFRLAAPQRVADVVALSEDSITYMFGRGEHTATWTKVTA